MELVGGVEEGLGWDTADIEASTSEGSSLFDTDGLESLLGTLDGSDVTAGASTNNCEVVLLGREAHSGKLVKSVRVVQTS